MAIFTTWEYSCCICWEEPWIQPADFMFSIPNLEKSLTLKVLHRPLSIAQWLHLGTGPSGGGVRWISLQGTRKLHQLQPCFLGPEFPGVPSLACSLYAYSNSSSKNVLFVKKKISRTTQELTLWRGHVEMPESGWGSITECTTWSTATKAAWPGRAMAAWVLDADVLGYSLSCLSCLLVFQRAGWFTFGSLPCMPVLKASLHTLFSLEVFRSHPQTVLKTLSFAWNMFGSSGYGWLQLVSLSTSPAGEGATGMTLFASG